MRQLISIAAVVAAVLAGMVAAQAAGLDIFGALAHWTDEIFRYDVGADNSGYDGPASDSAVNPEVYSDFKYALDASGIDESFAPSWIPDGFGLDGEIELQRRLYIYCIRFLYKFG